MKRRIIITGDGSTSIQLEDWNEQYHSKHGAIQEAEHVFIQSGLYYFSNTEINILEIGFGTGLNCLLTLLRAPEKKLKISYYGVEAYPVIADELLKMNYPEQLGSGNKKIADLFNEIHKGHWEEPFFLSPNFKLIKKKEFFDELEDESKFNLIYFDAFGPRVQPELWTETIFKKMYAALKTGGILVTYSAKGSVRRAMQEVGFEVSRLPGPPGKREMLRAIKK
jgi:tRNA U34 5-methylaminomethyl-2-thiouridine-forming methyltransferase MnmC